MRTDSGQSVSVWMATADVPTQSPLAKDVRADVCIVGAGIAGMTTAYVLAREGKSVVVLDDGLIAGGETCRTTAHLVNALDDRYYDTYAARVRAQTVDSITAAARAAITPDRLVWVVVGDRAKIESSIRALDLGEIRLIDADGNPIGGA